MPLEIIHYAEDVANGVKRKAIHMNAAEWNHFIFWLHVYQRIRGTAK